MRLTHRVLDLRRPQMQDNLRLRHRTAMAVRKHLDGAGFIDVETPMLYKSTPEGAREFLVPSRVHPGQFYALPQSPQLFKQMLMIAGYDRYYQITKCFRDEDLRAERQPEFTQIDIETSFLNEVEIRAIMENMIRTVYREAAGIELANPFPVMRFAEVMERYGSDKPDLRVSLELTDFTALMKTVDFKVFRAAAELADGRVAALNIPGGGTLTRKEIDDYTAYVAIYGAKGLAYIKVNDAAQANEAGLQSPIVKFMSEAVLKEILARTHAQNRRPDFFRRRPRQGGQRRAGCAAGKNRPRTRLRKQGMEAAVGGRFPDVRIRRKRQALGRAAPSLYRAQGRARGHADE